MPLCTVSIVAKMDHPIGFLDLIYGYFDTHIAFLKGSGSYRTFVRFIPNLKVQVRVQV